MLKLSIDVRGKTSFYNWQFCKHTFRKLTDKLTERCTLAWKTSPAAARIELSDLLRLYASFQWGATAGGTHLPMLKHEGLKRVREESGMSACWVTLKINNPFGNLLKDTWPKGLAGHVTWFITSTIFGILTSLVRDEVSTPGTLANQHIFSHKNGYLMRKEHCTYHTVQWLHLPYKEIPSESNP